MPEDKALSYVPRWRRRSDAEVASFDHLIASLQNDEKIAT